jgi:SAM-dependent methyltransferase/uncharacterized protein YbaR (Trm112 family)
LRPEPVRLIRCPACGCAGLTLTTRKKNDTEVREGELACPGCGQTFPIRGGILDLMYDVSEQVRSEITAWESMLDTGGYSDEEHARSRAWIRSLPFLSGQEGPPAELETWRRHGREAFRLLDSEDWRGRRVLEPGAGRCWLSAELARRGAEVTALDITPTPYLGLLSADVFFEEDGVYFERVLADMQRLPFEDGSFDAVVATATLHHSPCLEGLARELARVTRPGGKLLAANEPLLLPCRLTPAEEEAGAHEGSYTLGRWMRALRRAGWRLEAVEVGAWGDLHFKAVKEGGRGPYPAMGAKACLRYLGLVCLAPLRRLAGMSRGFLALHPMRPAPERRMDWLRARLLRRAAAGGLPAYGPGWFPEEGGDEPFRWSGPRSRLLLPPPPPGDALLLELASFRPGLSAGPARVEVGLGRETLGTIELDRPEWSRHLLEVPGNPGKGPVPLTLKVTRGWYVPAALGLGEDHRRLGVACRRAGWQAPTP